MNIELTLREFRHLLDLVYIGNWILNSIRGDDRFEIYDHIESKIFSCCKKAGMPSLCRQFAGEVLPSAAFENGGIHEAIADYENTVFFENLAEELALRDMGSFSFSAAENDELLQRIDEYIDEFSQNGVDNLVLEK